MNPERRDFDDLRPSATDAARDALDDLDNADTVTAAWIRRAAHSEALNRRYCEMLRRLVAAYEGMPFEFRQVAEGVAEEVMDLWSE